MRIPCRHCECSERGCVSSALPVYPHHASLSAPVGKASQITSWIDTIQNSLFSTQHSHSRAYIQQLFCTRCVEKGARRRQSLCGLVSYHIIMIYIHKLLIGDNDLNNKTILFLQCYCKQIMKTRNNCQIYHYS